MSVEIRTIRRYGWKPSLPDFRDIPADTSGLPVAPEVDPRKHMTTIYDQGQLGSCTANAIAAQIDYDRLVSGEQAFYPARLGIYFEERKIEGSPANADTGAFGRDGLKAAQKIGVWPESKWTYTDDIHNRNFYTDPQTALGAAPLKLERPYKTIHRSVSSFKRALSNNQTIAFGFTVYESFESSEVARTGIVPMPSADESQLGGHEVLLVGYLKDEPNYGLVRNSWGTSWGLDGYFLMPWSYLLDSSLADDHRTIYRPARG